MTMTIEAVYEAGVLRPLELHEPGEYLVLGIVAAIHHRHPPALGEKPQDVLVLVDRGHRPAGQRVYSLLGPAQGLAATIDDERTGQSILHREHGHEGGRDRGASGVHPSIFARGRRTDVPGGVTLC